MHMRCWLGRLLALLSLLVHIWDTVLDENVEVIHQRGTLYFGEDYDWMGFGRIITDVILISYVRHAGREIGKTGSGLSLSQRRPAIDST